MMKSLLAANRSEKDSFRIPHSVQQSIPIRRIYTDGIWQVGQKYSKTWRFSDINYAASSLDDRRSIFRSYGAVLNSLPTDATAKITIINRRLNPVDFQRTMLMPECSDGLDYYRGEYNQIILDKAAESNNLVQEKYIMKLRLPVNDSVLQVQLTGLLEKETITQHEIDMFYQLVDSLQAADYPTATVEQIIREELAPYLAGDTSEEEATQKIQSRVYLYLQEQYQ